MWILGRLKATQNPREGGQTFFTYDLIVGSTKQKRFNVPIECLRMPLVENENVSFYSTYDDRWIPAVVSGQQPAGVSTVGYTIKLLDGDNPPEFSAVPGARLRRRFPKDAKASVYLGTYGGWVDCVVLDSVEKEEDVDKFLQEAQAIKSEDFGLLGAPAGLAVRIDSRSLPPGPRVAARDDSRQRYVRATDLQAPTRVNGADVKLFTAALVRTTNGDERRVPSWLLRRRTDAETAREDVQVRQARWDAEKNTGPMGPMPGQDHYGLSEERILGPKDDGLPPPMPE
jgi:hypothetical protein